MNEIRDPIYGFITPTDTELKIINTPVFQRLRRVRQLAMAYLVYPGANHTRFDHSLGVYHLACRVVEQLLPEDEHVDRRRIVRLAALLHDIGHGPFSHTSEDVLNKYAVFSEGSHATDKIHELITAKLIQNDEELKKLISLEDRESIVGLLSGSKTPLTLMKDIVSGPLDVDKMDYLLRASHYCGVRYGIFDLNRMLNTLKGHRDEYDTYMAVDSDGINSLEQFVLAKYYMMKQVYYHKVRRVSDAMIIRGLELGIEIDEIEFLKAIFCYQEDDKYLKNYLNYWDDKVLDSIITLSNGQAKELFERLYHRKLFKIVFTERIDNLTFSKELIKDKIIKINSNDNTLLKKELEKNISAIFPSEWSPENVILNCTNSKSVKEMARRSEGPIPIIKFNGQPSDLETESMIFRAIDVSLQDTFVEVYAPFSYNDEKDKKEHLDSFQKDITKILAEQKEQP